MKLKIERAKVSDAKELIDFTKKIGSESDNVTFGPEGLPFTIEQEEDYLKNREESKLSPLFVARYEGEIIGIANLDVVDRDRLRHRGEIGISVLKDYWGNGIGSLLMQELIKFAIFNGVEVLYLTVRSDNDRAISLYKKFDFEKTGTMIGEMKINGELIDCDLMCLKI